jgi:L-threonylcarbamoyladenylate synthase
MSERYDCSDPEQREAGIAAAVTAVQKGELVVLPTDTVYGIGADAFTPWAVSRLLAAKGRGRNMPPPVLVGTIRAANALVEEMGPFGQDLVDQFWPGGLTLVCRATPTLAWDLGDTRGTVAVRMPLHAVALDLLKKTGPMAVSSANITGNPAATTADAAVEQLGDLVSVYLDGGPCPGGVASTIIDLTGSVPRLLRSGAVPMDRLREVAALVTGEDMAASGSGPGSGGLPGVPPAGSDPARHEPGLPSDPALAAGPAPAGGAAAPGRPVPSSSPVPPGDPAAPGAAGAAGPPGVAGADGTPDGPHDRARLKDSAGANDPAGE